MPGGGRPFNRADFQFSARRLLVALTLSCLISALLGSSPSLASGFVIGLVVLIVLFNDWSTWWVVLGTSALQTFHPPLAISRYSKAIAARPDLVGRRYYRGVAYLHDGNLESARRDAEASLTDDDVAPAAHVLLGWISVAEDDLPGALEHFYEAVRLGVTEGQAEEGLSYVWFLQGQYARALENIEACVRHYPRQIQYRYLLAWFLATCPDDLVRDGARALTTVEAATRHSASHDLLAELCRAAALAELGRFEHAVQHAKVAKRVATPLYLDEARRVLRAVRRRQPIRWGCGGFQPIVPAAHQEA